MGRDKLYDLLRAHNLLPKGGDRKILRLCFKHKIYFLQRQNAKSQYAMLLSKSSHPRKIRCTTYEKVLEAVEMIKSHKYELGRKPQFTPVDKRILNISPTDPSRMNRVRTDHYDENGKPKWVAGRWLPDKENN